MKNDAKKLKEKDEPSFWRSFILIGRGNSARTMVLILDGSSELGMHTWGVISRLFDLFMVFV